jgi:predicted AAA+ superfamily ATPase
MTDLYPRLLDFRIQEALSDTPVVLINGPRQCGKTTLVQQHGHNIPYLTLDDDNLLTAARADPAGFIRRIDRVVIDEIQHAPELLRAIKMSIDQDRRPGRFLLTGSANLLAVPEVSDSLAGRMEILTLLPLMQAEIERRGNHFLYYALNQSWPSGHIRYPEGTSLVSRVLSGGYPEMLARPTAARRVAWASAYLKALLERDVRDLSTIDKLSDMPRLLAVLAQLSGQLVNFTQIGGQLGMDSKTAQKYVGVLENMFLIKRVAPWSGNELSRLIKTPKLHFLDAGLQASLVRLTPERVLTDRARFGATLESWVCGELAKTLSLTPEPWQILHYRDKDQVEVDFVLESSDRQLIGIEVKAAATVTRADFRGLQKLQTLTGANFVSGIVLYDGEQVLSMGERLWAVPLALM